MLTTLNYQEVRTKEEPAVNNNDSTIVKTDSIAGNDKAETPDTDRSPMIVQINVPHVTWKDNVKSKEPLSFTG
ncbi:hypothetical protein RUM43_004543 [Polyplax serrata]|uniref:Uncharacterized protein n=1 Tax=Polyplax serrata TaxID=468196 RepID=A0AAN8SDC9_POLSC